jgi:hypothetical protein
MTSESGKIRAIKWDKIQGPWQPLVRWHMEPYTWHGIGQNRCSLIWCLHIIPLHPTKQLGCVGRWIDTWADSLWNSLPWLPHPSSAQTIQCNCLEGVTSQWDPHRDSAYRICETRDFLHLTGSCHNDLRFSASSLSNSLWEGSISSWSKVGLQLLLDLFPHDPQLSVSCFSHRLWQIKLVLAALWCEVNTAGPGTKWSCWTNPEGGWQGPVPCPKSTSWISCSTQGDWWSCEAERLIFTDFFKRCK